MNEIEWNDVIKDIAAKNEATAVQVTVLRDGAVIFSGGTGYQNIEENIVATDKTVFGIGSSTKAFAAESIAILVDEGKLEWDAPIRKYIPEFKLYDAYVSEHLTVKDMLCHRCGLPRHDFMWYLNMETFTEQNIMDRLKYLKPNNQFRYEMQYQNHMYFLAGQLIKRVSGMDWSEFVKERIFEPLGMSDSSCSMEVSKTHERMAIPYRFRDGKPEKMPFKNIDTVGSAGSINSTTSDMIKWVEFNLNKGQWQGKQIISEKNILECHSPQMIVKTMFPWHFDEIEFQNYGMGWFIESYKGVKVIHHGGTIDGYKALVSFIPSINAGFVILSSGDGNKVPTVLQYMLYDELLGLDKTDWNEKYNVEISRIMDNGKAEMRKFIESATQNTTPSLNLEAYAGTYENDGYGAFTIEKRDDQLHFSFGNIEENLTHISYDHFALYNEELMLMIPMKFEFDTKGMIDGVGMKIEAALNEMIPFRRVNE